MTKIIYKPSHRIHEPPWLIWHAKDLLEKAIKQKDSSKILYACLELRSCLEMIEFKMLLASVDISERAQIMIDAKPRHGIEKVNDRIKTLKYKYQIFYKVVAEVVGRSGNSFDLSKSSRLKDELSDYVHSYTREPEELNFDNDYIQIAIKLIEKVIVFVELALNRNNNSYMLQNLHGTNLSNEDKKILNDWKMGVIRDENSLRQVLVKKNKTNDN